MRKEKVFIVIPAYNEATKIGSVIDDLHANGYRDIIVVDDRSRDDTARIAEEKGAQVIRHERNMGQGAALRTGIREAERLGADAVVTFDGDGQHQASEIADLIRPVLEKRADVALGSRFLGRAPGMPWHKRVTLKGSILVERFMLGVRLSDVHNGFRAFSRSAAQTIEITCDDFAHASEIIAEIKDRKLSYVEVPVTIVYDDYAKRKGQSVLNAFRILKEIRRMKRERKQGHCTGSKDG